ncbi:MAG: signal peptide peptidase SppA [Bacteroidales bacterium]|nr:signal peptide peptidase SppA [Bacteroidales bacterium]
MIPEQKPESNSRKFWRIVLGTMVGFFFSSILVSILSLFFFIAILAGVSSGSNTAVIEKNSVLKITLDCNITERTEDNPFEGLDLGAYSQTSIGLNDIIKSLKAAATDDRISGVCLNVAGVNAAPATIEEIRNAIIEFKKSGKFVYGFSEIYAQNGYYLSTAADKVFIGRHGELEYKGMAMQLMFYKGLLDKLGVEMQVVRHGQFKSAVEPYILDKMSDANRLQMDKLCGSLWLTMTENISKARSISVDSLNYFADNLIPNSAEQALECHFVDGILFPSEFEDTLRNLVGIENGKDIHYVSLSTYAKNCTLNEKQKENKIAVVYAVGEIIDGKGNENVIGDKTLCKDIRDAYTNDEVKAIVLRVNSPGGSALASENIWHEIELAKQAGKVVVTSMGDYAASGGYYISCNSDAIVAEPNTLTGSIGVFGLIPNVQGLLKNKIGITTDVVKSNAHSDCFTGMRKLDPIEYARLQANVEECYATFIGHVAKGRNMTVEAVDEIGQGRVWVGRDALELGLVDKLGHIDDAIALASKLAKLSDYSIVYYPKQKNWMEKLVEKSDENKVRLLQSELGDLYEPYAVLKNVMNAKGVQARIPMEIIFD